MLGNKGDEISKTDSHDSFYQGKSTSQSKRQIQEGYNYTKLLSC